MVGVDGIDGNDVIWIYEGEILILVCWYRKSRCVNIIFVASCIGGRLSISLGDSNMQMS